MLFKQNDEITNGTLFTVCTAACKSFTLGACHSVKAARVQWGKFACIQKPEVEICRRLVQWKKCIQSTYFRYGNNISKCPISQNASKVPSPGTALHWCTL